MGHLYDSKTIPDLQITNNLEVEDEEKVFWLPTLTTKDAQIYTTYEIVRNTRVHYTIWIHFYISVHKMTTVWTSSSKNRI